MSRRWLGEASEAGSESIFSQFAERLRKLYQLCRRDPGLQISVLEFADEDFEKEAELEDSGNDEVSEQGHTKTAPSKQDERPQFLQGQPPIEKDPPSVESHGDDLSTISRILMDQRFTEMDRIMSYDDIMFNTRLEDFNAGSSDGWAIQGNDGTGSSGPFWNPN